MFTLLPEFNRKNLRIIETIAISGIVVSLSRVNLVLLFWSLFPVFPVYKPLYVYFILEAILLVVISGTPPENKPFVICFLSVFIACSLGSSFRYFPRFQTFFLLILVSSNFDWAKIFGKFFSVTYEWEVYIRVGHFEITETTNREGRKEAKKQATSVKN